MTDAETENIPTSSSPLVQPETAQWDVLHDPPVQRFGRQGGWSPTTDGKSDTSSDKQSFGKQSPISPMDATKNLSAQAYAAPTLMDRAVAPPGLGRRMSIDWRMTPVGDDPASSSSFHRFPSSGLLLPPRTSTPMIPTPLQLPAPVSANLLTDNLESLFSTERQPYSTEKAQDADGQNSANTGDGDSMNGSQSLGALLQLRENVPSTKEFAVLKLRNISWDLSISDVQAYFAPLLVPAGHLPPFYTQGIHIIMNRTTGKTLSDCFVEFPTYSDAQRALELHSRGILKGRVVVAQWSSQAELMSTLFPNWTGATGAPTLRQDSEWTLPSILDRDANAPVMDAAESRMPNLLEQARTAPFGSGVVYGPSSIGPAKEGIFLLREEINAILLICRNYKASEQLFPAYQSSVSQSLHPAALFSQVRGAAFRECHFDPMQGALARFEACRIDPTGSSVRDVEAYATNASVDIDITTHHALVSVESLRIHLTRDQAHISDTLLERMIRAGLCVPLFTERQKLTVLAVAHMECPQDLAPFVYNPPEAAGVDETDCKGDDDQQQEDKENVDIQRLSITGTGVTALSGRAPRFGRTASQDRLTIGTPRSSQQTFGAANGAKFYPSPQDDQSVQGDDKQSLSSPQAQGILHTPTRGSTTLPSPASSTHSLTSGGESPTFFAHRIRLLETALRHSQSQQAELRRAHEVAVSRAALEVSELRNAKIRAEKRALQAEAAAKQLEHENEALMCRIHDLNAITLTTGDQSSGSRRWPSDLSDAKAWGGGGAIASESIKNLWK
ncbi:hypothetical protein HDV00_000930 [Rhizophlyctis rosea]|nr:hypothetical protein HDV00_000930 [Rhizophlyctis rosea]